MSFTLWFLMRKSGWFALASILCFSFLISTLPLYEYSLWGLDCGEYFYYTQQWVESEGAYLSIDGWATAYPFFPGMFIVSGSFHILSGVDIFTSSLFVPVLINALAPLFLFLIVHNVMDDWRPALFSSLFFTTLPPIIYAYSQPRPETIGFFLFLFILSMSVTTLKKHKKTIGPIIFAMLALVFTHHLSSYFLILFYLGGIFVSKLWKKRYWPSDNIRTYLLILFLIFVFLYWIIYATPFFGRRIKNALIFPSYTIVLFPFLFIVILELLSRFRKKYDIVVPINLYKENFKSFLLIASVTLMIVVSILVIIAMGTFPVREIELGTTILHYLPIVFLGLFAVSARKIIRALEEGPTFIGWLIFILLSMTAGVIFDSSSLLPMRQLTFLLIIVSIFFGMGLYHFSTVIFNPMEKKSKTFALGILIILLISILVPLSYPSQERAGGFIEGVESEDMEGAFWAKSSLTGRISADHRISGALFSVSYRNVTWRDGYDMYFSSNFSRAERDIIKNNVSYLMWDEEMQKGAAIELGRNPQPLDPDLLEKYHERFFLVYSSEEVSIYAVNL